ncbi:MAG TPA: M20/M25/M40 family metallo-hydrolase [Anaeromyxobacteraceae bacterium]|nr:M20/M25/M40 family metallo-hydrolase [Anaeromyxobacteraceae bacterium]
MRRTILALLLPSLLLGACLAPVTARAQSPTPVQALGRDILRQLIRINTTHEDGNTTWAAESLAARFRAAGFPAGDVLVIGPDGQKDRNLVVRWRGRGKQRPVILMAHLDVVQALRSDWSMDPFTLTERDGYLYGRGVGDVKGGCAMLAAAMIQLKREGFVPDRDYILILTAGEEAGAGYAGIEWLIANRPELRDAAYALNVDAGGGELDHDRPRDFTVSAAEKIYFTVTFTVRNAGGHSSRPGPVNAIDQLAQALVRLEAYHFPVRLNLVTREYFEGQAALDTAHAADFRALLRTPPDSGAIARLSAANTFWAAVLHTTCVPTRLQGGHADNALPQFAQATVNCRLLPDESPDSIMATLTRIVNDTAVHIAITDSAKASPPTPLAADLRTVLTRLVRQEWGPVPIVPVMESGATDGLYLRLVGVPVFGTSSQFIDPADDRSHGRDERVPARRFDEGTDFQYRLLRALAGG